MLYRVDKKADDLIGLAATFFTGSASVSVIVDGEWGHFKRTGLVTGVFVIDTADEAMKRQVTMKLIGPSKDWHREYVHSLRGTLWRPWHNCFGVLRALWVK